MQRNPIRSILLPAAFATVAFAGTLVAPAAMAAVQRTFVSGSGSDLAACSLAAPCRSFAAAIGQTNPGGEIVVLDSAGYGPVAISDSVSIITPAGLYAGVTVMAGTGITVAGAGIVVHLRGLTINGQGGSGGVQFTQGTALYIEDCTISNMTAFGFQATGSVTAVVSRSRFSDNHLGIHGLNGATLTVNDTEVSRSDYGIVARSDVASVTTSLRVSHSVVRDSRVGIDAQSLLNTANTRLIATGNMVTGGQFGILAECACTTVGTIDALATGNTVSEQTQWGIASFGTGSTMVATRNSVTTSFVGLGGSSGPVLTLSDNASERNGTDASGLTPKTYH
jgi:hypothetical protein